MKREALHHTKMKRLCRRLEVPLYVGVGIMESIWHLTAKQTPRGDIGHLSDEDIAIGIDYQGDERKLVEALVLSGWLDADLDNRLVVHDWWEHADDAVHMKLARGHKFFSCGKAPKLNRLGIKERTACAQFYSSCAQHAHAVRIPCTPPEPEPDPVPVLNTICESNDSPQFGLVPLVETKKAAPLKDSEHPDFPAFWDLRWRTDDRKVAAKAFRKAATSPAKVFAIMESAKRQRPMYLAKEQEFRPMMSTWLNKGRFEDAPEIPELSRAPDVHRGNGRAAQIASVFDELEAEFTRKQ